MFMKNSPVIAFEHFTFQYYSQAEPTLHDINLKVFPGEKILIVGPSGSGKSTIGHCLNGLIPFFYKGAMQGSLEVKGQQTRDLDIFMLSKIIGTVLQDSDGQFVGLTVGEDIAFAMENDCISVGEMHSRVGKVAQMVDMDEHLRASPSELSGGQKQRTALAGVMIDDVDILLLVKDQTGAIVEELSQTAGTNDFSTTFADIDLPAGFYTLEISMSSTEEKLAALVDTALIIADTTSSATVELVVGLIADNNNFTIIDKTAKPLDGTINTDSENPSPDDTVTLTYVPILPDGATIEQLTLQWYCDGEPIVDANGATLVIENALGGTHRYDVVASIAAIGSVGSAHELVKVVVTPSIIE